MRRGIGVMLPGWLRSKRTALEDRLAVLEEQAGQAKAQRDRLEDRAGLCEALLAARGLAPPGEVPAGLLAAMAAGGLRAELETEDGSVIILLTGRPDDAAQVWKAVQDAGSCSPGGADTAFRRMPLPPGLRAVANRCADGSSVIVISTSVPRMAQREAVCELRQALARRSRAAAGPDSTPPIGRTALTVVGLTVATGVAAAALFAVVPHGAQVIRPVQSSSPAAVSARHIHRRRVRAIVPDPQPQEAVPSGPPLIKASLPQAQDPRLASAVLRHQTLVA
jgi:hypothetical protein